jgi:hypothetical protein
LCLCRTPLTCAAACAASAVGPAGQDEDLSRTEAKLRAKLNRLRTQTDRLEAAANRPIEAAIASHERIAWRSSDTGAGKNGEHK